MNGLLNSPWLNQLWGTWYFGVCTAVLLLAGICCCRSWIAQVVDWRWDRGPDGVYARKNRERAERGLPPIKVNWFRARAQQNAGLRLGYPLGLLGIAAMAYTWHVSYQGGHGMNMGVYGLFAILWFVTTPLRYSWQVRVAYRLNRLWVSDLRKIGMVEKDGWIRASVHSYSRECAYIFRGTASQMIHHHFQWAIATHSGNKRTKREFFYVHFTWLNPVIRFVMNFFALRWLGSIAIVAPVAFYGLASFVWPVALVFSVLYNSFEASDQDSAFDPKPWWRSRSSEPKEVG